ncbi:MAG: hypothetical protein GY754_45360 [bacterium]|nr:hypothetical protein [bacterium]
MKTKTVISKKRAFLSLLYGIFFLALALWFNLLRGIITIIGNDQPIEKKIDIIFEQIKTNNVFSFNIFHKPDAVTAFFLIFFLISGIRLISKFLKNFFTSQLFEKEENVTPGGELTTFREYSKEEKFTFVRKLLETVGKSFDSFKIKTFVDNGEKIELRGVRKGFPIKITCRSTSGLGFEILCKVKNRIKLFQIMYDESKIPTKNENDENDPFSDSDLVRVFVSKGLFLENSPPVPIEPALDLWERISDKLRNMFIQTLTGTECQYFIIRHDDIITKFKVKENNPAAELTDMVNLTSAISKEIEVINVKDNNQANKKTLYRLVACKYCGSRYPLTETAKCVNCGAAYE